MRLPLALSLALATSSSLVAAGASKRAFDEHDYYVLEHDPRAGAPLADVTRRLGMAVIERVGSLDNTWVVRAPRNHILPRAAATHPAVRHLARQELRQRVKRAPPPVRPAHPLAQAVIDRLGIADPTFPEQWHLVNEEFPEHMMNVSRLWEMGITGHGVVSALVDDGLDYESDDLAANFWAAGSYDYNDHEDLPKPKLFDDHHGTRCAGQIGAVKNNVCGVGIAYDSKVAGLRILSGPISDIDEAASLNYNYQNTSIYSCSWGPPDDGRSMESPGYLIQRAILNGVQRGRDGKGSIFVFASGNGAAYGDQCNFDGYTNSIYSITVAAVDYKGLHPIYSESCAANLVVAYSSGSGNHIVTTDVGKAECATTHGGTSAAAPNAVGIYALALSVRPDLTWRDMQHLSIRTAEVVNAEDPDWDKTAAGRPFSYKYGYGRLNGYEFVTAAQKWGSVKPQAWVELPAVQVGGGTSNLLGEMAGGEPIPAGGITNTITVTQEDLEENNFESLEHITVRVWITHDRRGDVEVEVTSPNGIKSVLAARRRVDSDKDGYPGWRFMSVKHWDEDPRGNWTIRVSDIGAEGRTGSFLGWQLALYGATIDASVAREYEISLFEKLLPSLPNPNSPPAHDSPSSTTKAHPKPTDHLPGNHGEAAGEADKPAFDNGEHPADDAADPSAPAASPSMTPTPDEGWFADMGSLVADQKWVFGAAALVLLFGLAAAVFLLRRRRARRAEHYDALPGDELALGAVARTPRTKELYDAFGEGADDDDDADEHTGLRGESPRAVGFHEGFLDDEDPARTPRTAPTPGLYRDEPEKAPASPSGSGGSGTGSGDGSWEHASQTR
ncbi:peptidase S8/S53 domain-containing protein [Gloeopeniophorella convolvens]|nr:peptidase S8/S53 domain-containing protein [Gloeopeniophorella convolvens]